MSLVDSIVSSSLRRPAPEVLRPVALPVARGPLSAWVLHRFAHPVRSLVGAPAVPVDAGWSDDLHLALFLCHDLHLGGFAGIDPALEWDPELIGFRTHLERAFTAELARSVVLDDIACDADASASDLVQGLLEADTSPSLSSHMETAGTLDQMREIVVHRSAYQLAEGDFHTFGIPRLRGSAKRSLAAIQAGEYGADGPGREMHSSLFARTMRSLGLDDRRHAHLSALPASALALSNLISTFGLQRRWRGALIGQLAAFELSSVVPMGRYAAGLRRMGAPEEALRFYDVHVLADAEHEEWAIEMVEHAVADEPGLAADVVFGAACTIEVERRFAAELRGRWRQSSQRKQRGSAA